MQVDTATAAWILRITVTHTHRIFTALRCTPVAVRGHGSRRGHRWRISHLLAAMTTAALVKSRLCGGEHAEAVGRVIGALSDETLEAIIRDGRSHIMLIGQQPLPRLVGADAIRATEEQYSETIREYGLEISAVDVRPLYDDLHRALAAVREGVSDATHAE